MIEPTTSADQRALRIGWVISKDRSWASSRLQGYLIHEWLVLNGHDSCVLCEDFNRISSVWSRTFFFAALRLARSDCDVIVFEGGEWPMAQLAKLWRRLGKRSVGVRCDQIPGAYDETYDLTIVPTESLRQTLKIKRAEVIEDSVEVRADQYKRDYAAPSQMRVVWIGHENYEIYITTLVASLKAAPKITGQFAFELISKGDFATRQWAESTVADDILACDIALIAIPQSPWFLTKSSNRLALMMALGMPTVATLIPSYEGLARDGENGLFVVSEDDIANCLLRLKDPVLREALGTGARKTVLQKFGIANIGPQWLSALESAMRADPVPLPWNLQWSLIAKLLTPAMVWRKRP